MSQTSARTVLITGLPRSGTTLTVALLNQQANAVALAEPLPLRKMSDDPSGFVHEIMEFAQSTRQKIQETGRFSAPLVDGRIATNYMAKADTSGRRKSEYVHGKVPLEKTLSPDFWLFIKHPAAFTALSNTLSKSFPLFACIRSPLAVLASWQTVDMPIGQGRLPQGERFSPSLADRLNRIPDHLDRQVALMAWFLDIYALFPKHRIICFENMVACPERELQKLLPHVEPVETDFDRHTLAERYPSVDFERLRAALRPIEPMIKVFYPEGLSD